jgi:hypothetical protein
MTYYDTTFLFVISICMAAKHCIGVYGVHRLVTVISISGMTELFLLRGILSLSRRVHTLKAMSITTIQTLVLMHAGCCCT